MKWNRCCNGRGLLYLPKCMTLTAELLEQQSLTFLATEQHHWADNNVDNSTLRSLPALFLNSLGGMQPGNWGLGSSVMTMCSVLSLLTQSGAEALYATCSSCQIAIFSDSLVPSRKSLEQDFNFNTGYAKALLKNERSSYLLAKCPSPTCTCPHLVWKYLQMAKTLPKGPRHVSYSNFLVRSNLRTLQQRLEMAAIGRMQQDVMPQQSRAGSGTAGTPEPAAMD